MIFTLPKDTEKFTKKFNELCSYVGRVELKKLHQKRSLNQNNYLHLILSMFAMNFGYTLAEAKQLYKAVNEDVYCYIITKPDKIALFVLRSSADLTTKEMTDSIEKFRNYSAEAGCYLPAPNEQEYLDHVANEIEKHKQWL
jgi:hypothetical protein